MAQDRVDLLRRGYEAINRGEFEPLLETLEPDAVCVEPDEFPAGGTYVGREGFAEYLRRNRAFWDTARTEPEEFIETGERIVALVRHRGRGRADGSDVDARFADVFTFRGDKIVRIEAFASREQALRSVGLE
jgi:ketosteroid isomerase-like protein